MARSSHIASVTTLINVVAGLCTLLWFYNITQSDGLIAPNIGIWLVLTLAAWLVNVLFLLKPRTILPIVILNVLLAAIHAFVLCLIMPPDAPVFSYTLNIAASMVSVALAGYYAVSPVYSDHLLPVFEISFIACVLLLWIQENYAFSEIVLAPVLFAVILNLLSLILVRVCTPSANSEGQSRMKGATVLIVLFVAILLLVAVFSLFLAAPIGDIALKIVDAVIAAFQQLMAWLSEFFHWLMDLLGIEIVDEDIKEKPNSKDPPKNYTAQPKEVSLIILAIIFAGLVFLVYKLRHFRFSLKFNRPSTAWLKRLFNDVKQTAIDIWHAFIFKLQSFFFDLTRKNTLQGLFYSIEYSGKRVGLPRGKGETPRTYLLRLRDEAQAAGDSALASELKQLSDITDKFFYSERSSALSQEKINDIRTRIAQFFKEYRHQHPNKKK